MQLRSLVIVSLLLIVYCLDEQANIDMAKQMFNMMDADQNGHLTSQEIGAFIGTNNQADIQKYVTAMDVNKDGLIQEQEYLKITTNLLKEEDLMNDGNNNLSGVQGEDIAYQ